MTKASGSIDLKSLKVAGEGASKYITTIDGGGIRVHNAGDITDFVQINSGGISIYGNSIKIADFGLSGMVLYDNTEAQNEIASLTTDGITIGNLNLNTGELRLDSNNLTLSSPTAGECFKISAIEGGLTETFTKVTEGKKQLKVLTYLNYNVEGSGTAATLVKATRGDIIIYLNEKVATKRPDNLSCSGGNISVVSGGDNRWNIRIVPTVTSLTQTGSFGNIQASFTSYVRTDLGTTQTFNIDISDSVSSTGSGTETKIKFTSNHQIIVSGLNTLVQSLPFYIKRTNTLVYTAQSPTPSFTLGSRVIDLPQGGYSTTIGSGLVAQDAYQTVIGKYNNYIQGDLFEIGNGTNSSPSNAFRINSSGSAFVTGGIVAGSTIRPSTDGGAALGSSSYKWGNIWTSSTLYKDEAPVSTATAYDCIWDKTSSNNYRLCRPSSSSIRYKKDITTSIKKELDPHNLYKLETKQFRFKEGYFEKDSPYELNPYDVIGFIAEDVEKYYPVACIKIDNEVENWDVRYIVPPMLSLVREQHEEIEKLKEEIKKLENKIN